MTLRGEYITVITDLLRENTLDEYTLNTVLNSVLYHLCDQDSKAIVPDSLKSNAEILKKLVKQHPWISKKN